MQFIENTDLLKVEDILPFFPDFVVIDDFKEEICTALEGYSAHIDALKADMDETTRNAEAIKQDITALQKRFITIDVKEKCAVCELSLLTRQFYVFPCHHTFHADCLIGLVSFTIVFFNCISNPRFFTTDKGVSTIIITSENHCATNRIGEELTEFTN